MPKRARIPKLGSTREKLERVNQLVNEMVDDYCNDPNDVEERSRLRRQIFELIVPSALRPEYAEEFEDPIH